MDSLTDPPPVEPYTPPTRAAWFLPQRGCGFWLLLLMALVILGLLKPVIIGSGRAGQGTRLEAIGNIKQIGLALCAFDQDYGQYPNAGTIDAVKKKTRSLLPLGTRTSNDYFRQLIAAECIDNEKSFFAR
ncbi:MAG: hypothetical protein NTV46_00125, partial [Verrucomicrobia bacterium]|nr:hypothetical protein [Verrucomicrobiota bacterium]